MSALLLDRDALSARLEVDLAAWENERTPELAGRILSSAGWLDRLGADLSRFRERLAGLPLPSLGRSLLDPEALERSVIDPWGRLLALDPLSGTSDEEARLGEASERFLLARDGVEVLREALLEHGGSRCMRLLAETARRLAGPDEAVHQDPSLLFGAMPVVRAVTSVVSRERLARRGAFWWFRVLDAWDALEVRPSIGDDRADANAGLQRSFPRKPILTLWAAFDGERIAAAASGKEDETPLSLAHASHPVIEATVAALGLSVVLEALDATRLGVRLRDARGGPWKDFSQGYLEAAHARTGARARAPIEGHRAELELSARGFPTLGETSLVLVAPDGRRFALERQGALPGGEG
jgi:hypothetical protein